MLSYCSVGGMRRRHELTSFALAAAAFSMFSVLFRFVCMER